MSSEVWNIAKQSSAQETYSSYTEFIFLGQKVKSNSLQDEFSAVKKITDTCKDMISSFHEIEDDKNQYIIEIDNLEDEYNSIKGDLQTQINKLLSEIKVLEAKEQDGSITEEEKEELYSKKGKFDSLMQSADQKCADTKSEMSTKKSELSSKYSEKEKLAADYGRTAVEKGKPWAELDVELSDDDKKSLEEGKPFLSIFNHDKNKKLLGTLAVQKGEELLDKVNNSKKITK